MDPVENIDGQNEEVGSMHVPVCMAGVQVVRDLVGSSTFITDCN